MFRQHVTSSEMKTKKQKTDMPVKEQISYPGYLPERIAVAETYTPGYIEDMVIQRRPSDFRKAAASERASDIHSVAVRRSQSNWGKVELAMEEYAALPEDQFDIRLSKLDELETIINEYRNAVETDTAAITKKPQRLTYCDQLNVAILREYAEIRRLSGDFVESSQAKYIEDDRLHIETAKETSATAGRSGAGAAGKLNETMGVMFLRNVKRLDKTAAEIPGQWNEGMVACFFDGWSEPGGTVDADTHEKVTDEKDVSFFSRVGTGFVKKEDVIKVNRTIAQSGYKYKKEAADAPLFADTPKAADVKQGALGDCYLLSAMIAVVSQNPEHFLYHMLDCGDTVIVRMYRSDGNPTFVKVDKSVVVKKLWHNRTFADGALWVPIYEKAYAAAGFTGNDTELPSAGKRSYGFISGGQASIALQHITGQKAVEDSFDPKKKFDKEIDKLLQDFSGLSASQDPYIRFAIQQVIGEGRNMLDLGFLGAKNPAEILAQYVGPLAGHIRRALSDIRGAAAANTTDIQKESQIINEAAGRIKKIMRKGLYKYMPGILGTGKYSREEIGIFRKIKDRLDAGQPVVLSSKHDVSELLNGQQGAGRAGEGVGGGLVGPHGYAVLECRFTGNLLAPTQLLVKLRNPWGNIGRGYFSAPGGASNQRVDILNKTDKNRVYGAQIEDGEFWIDMSDIVRYFNAVSYIQ